MMCIGPAGKTRWLYALVLMLLIVSAEAFPSKAKGEGRKRSPSRGNRRRQNKNTQPDPTPSTHLEGPTVESTVTSTSGGDHLLLPSATPNSNGTNTTTYDQPSVCVDGGSWCRPSNSCIPADKRCDGASDCSDRSDEQCQDLLCCPSSNFHFCQHNGTQICIPLFWFCDGEADCDSSEDESEDVFQQMKLSCFNDDQKFLQNPNFGACQ